MLSGICKTAMGAAGELPPGMETATGESLQAAGARTIPFALTTSTGAQVTLSIRLQLSNVRTPTVTLEDLLKRGIQPIFRQDESCLECPRGEGHLDQVSANSLDDISQIARGQLTTHSSWQWLVQHEQDCTKPRDALPNAGRAAAGGRRR